MLSPDKKCVKFGNKVRQYGIQFVIGEDRLGGSDILENGMSHAFFEMTVQ